jgi:hypothetical protein
VIYIITYQKDNEPHTIEWVVPQGWNAPTIAQAFEKQYPAATLLGMEPRP